MIENFEELKRKAGEYVPFCRDCRRFSTNPLNITRETLETILEERIKIHHIMYDEAPDPGGSASVAVLSYSVDPMPFIDFHRHHNLEVVTLEWIRDNL